MPKPMLLTDNYSSECVYYAVIVDFSGDILL